MNICASDSVENEFKPWLYVFRVRVQHYWTRMKINVPENA
jgi:predicted nucleotidyltransferase